MNRDVPESGIELVRRAASADPADPIFAAVAECLRAYLAGAPAGCSLDEAFGIAVGPGGESWHARERRDHRDRELRAMVERYASPGLSSRGRAAWLALWIRRYETSGWLRDREAGEPPAHYAGNERECLFRAFKAAKVPTDERQLRRILLGDARGGVGHQTP